MGKIDFNKNKLTEQMDRIVKCTMEMDLTWDWPCGVAYYGIARAYESTGKEEYLNVMKERVDELIDLGLPSWTVNTCAMGHCLITIYQKTKEEKYLELIHSKINYLRKDALRFGDSVLQHTVSAKNDFPEQCWADTLFMAGYFMLRVGVMEQDQSLIDDALNQFYWHIQYLQDTETGLWYHAYSHLEKHHMSGFYWGRANCWAAYTMSRVGRILPECYLYPQYMEISGSVSEQLAAVKLLQTENGLYRTLLDDMESYEEISASAGIGAAMVERGNPLYYKYISKTVDGVMNNVSERGKVLGVSGGTAVMKDRDGYRNIPKKWIQGWGQGLSLAFFAAVLESENIDSDGAL